MRLHFIWLGGKGDWKYLRADPWFKRACQPELPRPSTCHLHGTAFASATFAAGRTACLCVRQCFGFSMQDWYDQSADAAWRHERPDVLPFKGGMHPFFPLPGGGDPRNILIDVAHTFHIKGVGVDFCASAVVMMCRKNMFGRQGRGHASLDVLIHRAFSSFMEYCYANHKTTGCRPWSTRHQLDMSSNNSFPGTISGKGHDTGLVCSWISVFLDAQPQDRGLKTETQG